MFCGFVFPEVPYQEATASNKQQGSEKEALQSPLTTTAPDTTRPPLTNSEVGKLGQVMPGTRHFHKIIQNMHSVKLQAFGFVHSAQNVL